MGYWFDPRSWFRRERRNSPERPSTSLANPDSWFTELHGGKSDAGIPMSPAKALEIATVWQCVALLTDDFAKLMPYVYADDESTGNRTPARTHAAYRLLKRKANRVVPAGQWRRTMLHHALMYGNGYSWITRNGRMEPQELLLLDPTLTEPKWVDEKLFYVTQVRDMKLVLTASEVFHLRGVGFDGVKGYSIVEHAYNSFGLTLAAEKYGSKHFANGTRVSGILQYPGRLSPNAARDLEKSFQSRHEGLDNAHKTILLEEGAKFIPTHHTPNEAQMVELRVFQRKEVAAWFKIPPSKLGDPDSVSYNSLEQWNQAYLESALDPWLFSFEEEAIDKLLTEEQKRSESHFVEFNRDALLRTDLESRYRAYAIGKQWGWLNSNSILRKENEDTIGPQGDVYLSPVNMTNAERMTTEALDAQDAAKAELEKSKVAAAAKAQAEAPKAKPAKSDAKEKARALLNSDVSRAARRLTASGRKAVAKEDWLDAVADRLNDHQQVLASSLATSLGALSLIEPRAESEVLAVAAELDARIMDDVANLFAADEARDQRVAKWDAWSSRFLNDMVPHTVEAMTRAFGDDHGET